MGSVRVLALLALGREVVAVAAVSIRNLDDTVRERLRIRAAAHGRSMEAEMRAILMEAVREPGDDEGVLGGCMSVSPSSGVSTLMFLLDPYRREPSISQRDSRRHQRRLGVDESRTLSRRDGVDVCSWSTRPTDYGDHRGRDSYGIQRRPSGRRRTALRDAAVEIFSGFSEGVLPFDLAAATVYPDIVDHRDRQGCRSAATTPRSLRSAGPRAHSWQRETKGTSPTSGSNS